MRGRPRTRPSLFDQRSPEEKLARVEERYLPSDDENECDYTPEVRLIDEEWNCEARLPPRPRYPRRIVIALVLTITLAAMYALLQDFTQSQLLHDWLNFQSKTLQPVPYLQPDNQVHSHITSNETVAKLTSTHIEQEEDKSEKISIIETHCEDVFALTPAGYSMEPSADS